jgi:outer membrane receptor protein involved in Fe transport
VRISFNKAFRAPSFINNHLQTSVLNEVNLSPISPLLARFIFPVGAVGNPNLKQESLTAYELGYTGVLNKRATVTASVYWNSTKDAIFFTPATFYSPASPPPTWPAIIPTFALALLPTPLPSSYTYLNLGKVKDKGFEVGIDASATRDVNVFVNYSYQADPGDRRLRPARGQLTRQQPVQRRLQREPRPVPRQHGRELQRVGLLAGRAGPALRGHDRCLHAGERAFGVRWSGEKIVTSIKIMNIGNSEVQQHIFGDVLRRQVVGEVRLGF